jgi:hypothetical protein
MLTVFGRLVTEGQATVVGATIITTSPPGADGSGPMAEVGAHGSMGVPSRTEAFATGAKRQVGTGV